MTKQRIETHIAESRGVVPEGGNQSSILSGTTVASVEQKVSAPHEFIEGLDELPIHVFRLPLGPTAEHIQGMLDAGTLAEENVFVGPERWKEFYANAEIPQVMGRQIENDDELERIVTDKETVDFIRSEVKKKGAKAYPVIYVMNHEARLEWAEYLGGRIPTTQQEQMDIWNALPGNNVLAKATHAGIPFTGYFNEHSRKFHGVSRRAYLMSSFPYLSGYRFLNLYRSRRVAFSSWLNSLHGCSVLVVKDKA